MLKVFVSGTGEAKKYFTELWKIHDAEIVENDSDITHYTEEAVSVSDIKMMLKNAGSVVINLSKNVGGKVLDYLDRKITTRSVFFYSPLIYNIVFLEIKRIIDNKTYGRVEFVKYSGFGSKIHHLDLIYRLFAERKYNRTAAKFLLPDDSISINLENTEEKTLEAWGEIIFSSGKIHFRSGIKKYIECFPDGNPSFFTPLPEDRCGYYFISDLIESLINKRESRIFPPPTAIGCRRWGIFSNNYMGN